MSLFSQPGTPGSLYEAIRTSGAAAEVEMRRACDQLWDIFKEHADQNFEEELRTDFHSRFWEMHLTCSLILKGFNITCPKPGPDILIEYAKRRVWIEAIAPEQGAVTSPDRVPDRQYGVVTDHPEEQIILRYRAAIREKYDVKYRGYLDSGIIGPDDPFIIAINSAKLPHAWPENFQIPGIVKAVFPVGPLQLEINRKTRAVVDSFYQYRAKIQKSRGAPVDTNIFLSPVYDGITGILFSHVTVARLAIAAQSGFIFIHNPVARNRLPRGFLGATREWSAKEKDTAVELIRYGTVLLKLLHFKVHLRNWFARNLLSP